MLGSPPLAAIELPRRNCDGDLLAVSGQWPAPWWQAAGTDAQLVLTPGYARQSVAWSGGSDQLSRCPISRFHSDASTATPEDSESSAWLHGAADERGAMVVRHSTDATAAS